MACRPVERAQRGSAETAGQARQLPLVLQSCGRQHGTVWGATCLSVHQKSELSWKHPELSTGLRLHIASCRPRFPLNPCILPTFLSQAIPIRLLGLADWQSPCCWDHQLISACACPAAPGDAGSAGGDGGMRRRRVAAGAARRSPASASFMALSEAVQSSKQATGSTRPPAFAHARSLPSAHQACGPRPAQIWPCWRPPPSIAGLCCPPRSAPAGQSPTARCARWPAAFDTGNRPAV